MFPFIVAAYFARLGKLRFIIVPSALGWSGDWNHLGYGFGRYQAQIISPRSPSLSGERSSLETH
jgi:hypothetical protein